MKADQVRAGTRERIIAAAAGLLAEGGSEAVSTRAVAAAAGVQAPALYRLFGDKQGLLDAVTGYGFEQYLAGKHALTPTGDPVQDIRDGWDLHTEFGLTHPAFYILMYGSVRPGRPNPASEEAARILRGLLERVAHAGRLRLPVELAAQMIGSTGAGVTLALIATPPDLRDPELSPRVRETVLAAITNDSGDLDDHASLGARALALDAALADKPTALTERESALLHEWLERLTKGL